MISLWKKHVEIARKKKPLTEFYEHLKVVNDKHYSNCISCYNQHQKEYYQQHKEEFFARNEIWRNTHKELFRKHVNEYRKKYRRGHLEEMRLKEKQRRAVLRIEILEHYGRKCSCPRCGETNLEFLSMDHINGGGNRHRKSLDVQFYDWIKKNNYPNELQILCFNCNLGRARDKENGICPHEQPLMEETKATQATILFI